VGSSDPFLVFDHLPLVLGEQARYVEHLWDSFSTLFALDNSARGFALLPFHLIFMTAVQIKCYRLSGEENEPYLSALSNINRLYSEEDRLTLQKNCLFRTGDREVARQCSPMNLSLIPEKRLFDIFVSYGLSISVKERAVELIDIRGDYAHANGRIEEDLESRIDGYLEVLSDIQLLFIGYNDKLALEWCQEISDNGLEAREYIEGHLPNSLICRGDFRTGIMGEEFEALLSEG